MNSRLPFAALLLSLTVFGCGSGNRFDASTQEAIRASKERMTAGLSAQDVKQFEADCMAIVMSEGLKDAIAGAMSGKEPDEASAANAFKALHGMTREQIAAAAAKARENAKKSFGGGN